MLGADMGWATSGAGSNLQVTVTLDGVGNAELSIVEPGSGFTVGDTISYTSGSGDNLTWQVATVV